MNRANLPAECFVQLVNGKMTIPIQINVVKHRSEV